MKPINSERTLNISNVSAIFVEAQATATRQVEFMLGSSSKAFDMWQSISTSWLQRRTEDMQIAMDAAQRLAECRDPSQATSICAEWLSENVRLLQDELSTYSGQLNSLTVECLGSIYGEAGAKAGQPALHSTSSIKRAA